MYIEHIINCMKYASCILGKIINSVDKVECDNFRLITQVTWMFDGYTLYILRFFINIFFTNNMLLLQELFMSEIILLLKLPCFLFANKKVQCHLARDSKVKRA